MDTAKIGDQVVVTDGENKYYGQGALVVSHPLEYRVDGKVVQFVAIKILVQEYGSYESAGWKEIFMVSDVALLEPDTGKKFEEARCRMKFGDFHSMSFLTNPLDTNSECAVCHNAARVRIEINIWGSIHQYDVCGDCAKKYDGIRTDGLPRKAIATHAQRRVDEDVAMYRVMQAVQRSEESEG